MMHDNLTKAASVQQVFILKYYTKFWHETLDGAGW